MPTASASLLAALKNAIAIARTDQAAVSWPEPLKEAVRALGYTHTYSLEHVSMDNATTHLAFHVTTSAHRSHFHTLPLSVLDDRDVDTAVRTHQASETFKQAGARVDALKGQLALAEKDLERARKDFWEVQGVTPG